MPEATAAGFSNKEWIHGIFQDDSGYGVVVTSKQPVALATITSGPIAREAAMAATICPQPAQARCPGAIKLSPKRPQLFYCFPY